MRFLSECAAIWQHSVGPVVLGFRLTQDLYPTSPLFSISATICNLVAPYLAEILHNPQAEEIDPPSFHFSLHNANIICLPLIGKGSVL